MKIQFFNPSVRWYSNFEYRTLPALSLPILAAVFNRAGHTAEVTDLEALGVTPEILRDAFIAQKDRWPDVIGITAITMTQRGAQATIKALRDAGFTGYIVVGGVHVTIQPQDGLDWGADLVVTGECEGNVVDLFESGATGIRAGVAAPISEIPMPDWDHHNPILTTYKANLAMLRPMPSTSQWTRGCPYNCTFCGNVVFAGQRTRYRPPTNIIAEMTDLRDRGARHCFVYDDELIGGRQPEGWMREVANGVEPLGIKWLTLGRCSQRFVTPEILAEAKRAGCFYIFWGVESLSQPVLNAMKKKIRPSDVWHTLRVSKEAGIKNAVLMMVGNYGETEADLALTAETLGEMYREGLIQYRQTTVCTPMPGTEFMQKAQEEGWYHEPLDQGEQMLTVHQGTPWVSGDRLQYWLREFDRLCPAGEWGQA